MPREGHLRWWDSRKGMGPGAGQLPARAGWHLDLWVRAEANTQLIPLPPSHFRAYQQVGAKGRVMEKVRLVLGRCVLLDSHRRAEAGMGGVCFFGHWGGGGAGGEGEGNGSST